MYKIKYLHINKKLKTYIIMCTIVIYIQIIYKNQTILFSDGRC